VESGRWSGRGGEDARMFSSADAALPSRRAKLEMAGSGASRPDGVGAAGSGPHCDVKMCSTGNRRPHQACVLCASINDRLPSRPSGGLLVIPTHLALATIARTICFSQPSRTGNAPPAAVLFPHGQTAERDTWQEAASAVRGQAAGRGGDARQHAKPRPAFPRCHLQGLRLPHHRQCGRLPGRRRGAVVRTADAVHEVRPPRGQCPAGLDAAPRGTPTAAGVTGPDLGRRLFPLHRPTRLR
jgi:hypothetical protein